MPYIPAAAFAGGAPKPPSTQIIQINQFNGIDLSSKPTLMSLTRSPDCRNMMRSAPGKVKRRMGYERVNEQPYSGRINGATTARPKGENERCIVHAGNNLYMDGTLIAGSRADAENEAINGTPITTTGLANHRSCITKGNCIFDGLAARLLVYADKLDGSETRIYFAPKLSDSAYVPTVMIDRDPKGGGTAYEDVNMLSDAFTELFYADGESTSYQMSFDDLIADAGATVKLMNDDGITWRELTEGVDYNVNYVAGVVRFVTAPAVTPVDGQSNVSITVSKDRSEKRAWIDKCTVAVAYQLPTGGTRIFATGNPEYPNRDYWSEIDDYTYWSDLNYSILGDSRSKIIGYSNLGSYLATHKSDGSIYIRTPVTDTSDANRQSFPTMNIIRGPKNTASFSYAELGNEPLFLTENGVFALTSADLTAEKYAQDRSFYINGSLLKENNINDAIALVWKDYYMLAVNHRIYLLDGSMKTYTPDEPHSTYQYEAFLWTGIPARCLWQWNNELYFGDDEGNVYRFDESLLTDNGEPFLSCWETPDLQGGLFHKQRRYTKAALQIQPGDETDIDLSVNGGDGWRTRCVMAFPAGAYARRTVRRLDMAKVNYAALRISCGKAQPFEPDAINIEYIQSGRDDKRL
ncbi:MAG: hypothetical protein E7554_01925 [Ruminococcaceae bacterium]|nr:hypothetical protein [Oscillospiraceae bacterium]